MALYLMCVYGDQNQRKWFEAEWKKAGKKLDMGKSCVRFKKVDDLALDVIGETIRRVTARKYIANCEQALNSRQKAPAKKAAAVRKAGKLVCSTKSKKPAPKKARIAGKR
jgi:hypothetical protein